MHPLVGNRCVLCNPPGDFLERCRVGNGNALAPADGDSLQVFGAHHRSHACPSGGGIEVIHDTGKPDQFLPAGADIGHLDQLVAKLIADGILALQRLHSPQVAGIFKLDLIILNRKIDRFFCLTFHDYGVKTGHFQLRSPVASGIGLAKSAGER